MKNKIFSSLVVLAIFLFLGSCKKVIFPAGVPSCIQTKVIEFKANTTCDGAKVNQFSFQGKTVYTFDPGLCGADEITEVFDNDCSSIGALGGLIGNTKINNEDFSKAVLLKTIWEK